MELIKKNIDKIKEIIEQIKIYSDSGVPVIVEGIKDKQSLEMLGIKQNVITLQGKSLLQIDEVFMDKKEVIILTDFDAEGKKLAFTLQKQLMHRRISPNLKFWKSLKFYLKKNFKDIESLAKIFDKMQ